MTYVLWRFLSFVSRGTRDSAFIFLHNPFFLLLCYVDKLLTVGGRSALGLS